MPASPDPGSRLVIGQCQAMLDCDWLGQDSEGTEARCDIYIARIALSRWINCEIYSLNFAKDAECKKKMDKRNKIWSRKKEPSNVTIANISKLRLPPLGSHHLAWPH